MSDVRYTKRGEKTLQLAYREALSLGTNTVDTAHLARALQRQMDGIDWYALGQEMGQAMSRAIMDALAVEDAK